MKTTIKSRTLRFRQHMLHLCGMQGDRYFEQVDLSDEGENAFFLQIMDRCITAESTAIDVGANIGLITVALATVIRSGMIYSFEPSPKAFPALTETLKANRVGNARTFQLALAEREDTFGFSDNPLSAAASHLRDASSLDAATTEVRATTLDAFVDRERIPRVDFIKIDVEGFEQEVLKGAARTLRDHRPNVFLEFNSFTLIAYGNKNPRRVLEDLLSAFPHVYCFQNRQPSRIGDQTALLGFLHRNLVEHGCVDDLYCSSVPIEC
jgi:FkbM family methyltransferase